MNSAGTGDERACPAKYFCRTGEQKMEQRGQRDVKAELGPKLINCLQDNGFNIRRNTIQKL